MVDISQIGWDIYSYVREKKLLKQIMEFLVVKSKQVSLTKDLTVFNILIAIMIFQGIRDHYIMKYFQNYLTMGSSSPLLSSVFLSICLFLTYF